ncbi:chloride channel protein [Paracoccus seriniphilus]|uniref:Chloride channel protein, CIC family n=1 Tax=Paracoccus seriniphilus TaxID=184748 RepID=A0A239PTK4_9RHOB|nr:chloride channel protein [Paracoccus seriniphilus]WCR16475.1 chloride channel protein [Paracoccus seriniphilus]SNT73629.1 chloride channel protein, CIC family [Paracoccus seriniphilus]
MPHKRHGLSFPARLGWLRRRLFARGGEVGFLVLAVTAGVLAGCVVSLIRFLSHLLHSQLYGVAFSTGLSGSDLRRNWLLIAVPVAGGLLTSLILSLRRRRGGIVDPIEANALYGGRMSLADSIWVTLQNLASNGFGLSAGLEAAYTQLSSGLASKLGLKMKLRREDMRVLIGCGSAGAIAAAFGAPLTGAFYAFELIIGTYSAVSLAPVIAAAIAATLVSQALSGKSFTIEIGQVGAISPGDFLPALGLGACCALLGILVMMTVVRTERLASASGIPSWLRPALGGILVGGLAFVTPQVLSAGHGAMHINLENEIPWTALLILFALKALGSAITIGSGFRGGLFFASLLLGALIGKAAAVPLEWLAPGMLSPTAMAVIGMTAFGVAVIGGPLAMTFLALELTGEFPITALALAAAITSSMVVRQTFGYSFTTWRFHLRGQSIRSAHDVGWIRNLTVGRLMRRDVRTASADMSIDEFRAAFPLGSTQRVIITDDKGGYCAMVQVAEVHADQDAAEPKQDLSEFFHHQTDVLLPGMNARQAAGLFEASHSESLAVVSDRIERRVIGQLSEAHTLRRYSEELDKQRRDITGSGE